jgi:hypothetical protein
VGDALGMLLNDLHSLINRRLHIASVMHDATAEVVDTVLLWWPERTMARYASKPCDDHLVLGAVRVIAAKVREDLEMRWGTAANTLAAIDHLLMPVVVEVANIWFGSTEQRIDLRRCMWEVRYRSGA